MEVFRNGKGNPVPKIKKDHKGKPKNILLRRCPGEQHVGSEQIIQVIPQTEHGKPQTGNPFRRHHSGRHIEIFLKDGYTGDGKQIWN